MKRLLTHIATSNIRCLPILTLYSAGLCSLVYLAVGSGMTSWTSMTNTSDYIYKPFQSIHVPQSNPLIVHYITFHKSLNPDAESASLSFIECMSVLSVMKNLAPDAIYLHTNVPEFWPFDPCNAYIHNWTTVRVIPVRQKFTMHGSRIRHYHHEADVKKLEAILEYGGVAMDFDVYVINGPRLRQLLTEYPCLACRELPPKIKLNMGFIACDRPGSLYPQLVLKEYYADFRPDAWVYNSGEVPMRLKQEHNETVYVVEGICDAPDYDQQGDFLSKRGYSYTDWMDKPAHHTFLHDRGYTRERLQTAETSFGDMLNWLLDINTTATNMTA